MTYWQDFDIDRTIRDFDYTKRAAAGMNRIIDSAPFEDMDAGKIFQYLSKEMEVVLFPDYLKRYIYQKLAPDEPFAEMTQAMYQEIIASSFEANRAPYSFTPTTTKRSAMIKLWLTLPNVRRSTIFILGFGLRMTAEEVSEFLTKVIKEADFDFTDPRETVYWYCYKHDLPYSSAVQYLRLYEEMPQGGAQHGSKSSLLKGIKASPAIFLLSEENFLFYLSRLRATGEAGKRSDRTFAEFVRLYDRCREVILDMHNEIEQVHRTGKHWELGQIRPADLEGVLCYGIPLNDKRNLKAMSASRFAQLFRNKRMSRQRISTLLARKQEVDRFDLITLLFYIYAETVEPDWPTERYLKYIDDVNALLNRCGMLGIYPANPYEAFILMCLIADDPLAIYSEVWQKSYEEMNEGAAEATG